MSNRMKPLFTVHKCARRESDWRFGNASKKKKTRERNKRNVVKYDMNTVRLGSYIESSLAADLCPSNG